MVECFKSHYDEGGRLIKDEDDDETSSADKKLVGPSMQLISMQVEEINK